ncbi:NAD(P)H-dependent oxidoreductase [Palleronia caenipelagi]|uniref:NAD(P)H-dependent oxidoreductase n=1 Tax=Palleronia caenipelagi TaxID=2489174 RepID=A0A547Q629_9RHOB|nr:NAD(P)H-dependent oxidoreductase [Palleronia caenipelagi]TRD21824.1 NAD(P)H-dependent oxidoreductase [Palleronia caenipelagi]
MNIKSLNEHLSWRYATKKMTPEQTVPEDKVNAIVEAIRMAPTSSGTQPFEIFVIRDADLRAKIRKVARDQSPITDGSHLIVFAAWDDYTAERIDEVLNLNIELRGDVPGLKDYYENLKEMYLPLDARTNFEHAARQAYIALGVGMVAAAEQEVDSTPMEGFDPDKVDEILGLREKGLRSVVLLPLGYRHAEEDWLLPMPKVRKSRERLVTEI